MWMTFRIVSGSTHLCVCVQITSCVKIAFLHDGITLYSFFVVSNTVERALGSILYGGSYFY